VLTAVLPRRLNLDTALHCAQPRLSEVEHASVRCASDDSYHARRNFHHLSYAPQSLDSVARPELGMCVRMRRVL